MDRAKIYQTSNYEFPLRQGEILTQITQYKPIFNNNSPSEIPIFQPIIHPYAIIVTQDCDLDWDYKARFNNGDLKDSKLLNSIILCEVDTAERIRYIPDKNTMNSKEWDLVKSHRHERFYFFETIPPDCELNKEGLPELTADFKKVFGIDSDFLYQKIKLGITQRRTILISPYLEHFSKRYYNFHGRVALPSQYESEKQS